MDKKFLQHDSILDASGQHNDRANWASDARLNMKTVFPGMMISIIKIRRETVLSEWR